MTDEPGKRRRVLIGIFAVIALIGLIGTGIALSVSNKDTITPATTTSPSGGVNPLSLAGICGSASTASYVVVPDKQVRREFTATAAAQPWLRSGESQVTTRTGAVTTMVAIGKAAQPPREVLIVTKTGVQWQVSETGACLDKLKAGQTCAHSTLIVKGSSYKATQQTGSASSRLIGQASLVACVRVGNNTFASRGQISPVSAYAGPGSPAGSVLITENGASQEFGPAK
jgi:hypothetical protein